MERFEASFATEYLAKSLDKGYNNVLILAPTLPRIKSFVLPFSVPEEKDNGYGTNTTTRHNWAKEQKRISWSVTIKANPNQDNSCVA